MNIFSSLLLGGLAMLMGTPVNAQQTVIAFAQDTLANDFRRQQVFEVRDTLAEHANIEFVYSDAKGKVSLLIHQIETYIAQQVGVLIVGTNDAQAVSPIISQAHQQGIAVIILDRGVNTDDYTSFINSDNLKIGTMAADFIAQQLRGKGTALLFEGLPTADVTQLRSDGFLNEIARYPEIKVLRRTGNYLRKDAIIEMEKLLAEGIHVDAIFAESDSMLSGVRLVLQQSGIDPSSLLTVGCDYTSEAREAIRDGSQTASILFPLGGKEAAELALSILRQEPVPHHISIPVQLITRDNVEVIPAIF